MATYVMHDRSTWHQIAHELKRRGESDLAAYVQAGLAFASPVSRDDRERFEFTFDDDVFSRVAEIWRPNGRVASPTSENS